MRAESRTPCRPLNTRLNKTITIKYYRLNKTRRDKIFKIKQQQQQQGAIALLNSNPDLDIDLLLKSSTAPISLQVPTPLTPAITTKPWKELLNYNDKSK